MTNVAGHWLPERPTTPEHPEWTTAPTSMGQGEFFDLPAGLRDTGIYKTWQFGQVPIVVRPPLEETISIIGPQRWGKWYWSSLGGGISPSQGIRAPAKEGTNVIILEVAEEQLGTAEEVLVSSSPWPGLWQTAELDANAWRGVFSLRDYQETLFSEQVEIRTVELPRWQPCIRVDLARIEREDD